MDGFYLVVAGAILTPHAHSRSNHCISFYSLTFPTTLLARRFYIHPLITQRKRYVYRIILSRDYIT